MRTQLYAHNKAAYQKVMKAFETSDRTCVVHPTGTGKSYLIAAVSENYKKVLILAPSNFILQQQRDVMKGWPSGIDFATYQALSANIEAIAGSRQYDLIVLDEFHRAGAPEWSAAVSMLIESQPQAKIFGTSATPIRYLDKERDMERTVNHLIEEGCGSAEEKDIEVDDAVDITDDKDVILRDANWYTDITVNRLIPVRGYLSHRWCGSGNNKHICEVWVRPHVKSGYHRTAGVKNKGE